MKNFPGYVSDKSIPVICKTGEVKAQGNAGPDIMNTTMLV
jgi:hypothetical protein